MLRDTSSSGSLKGRQPRGRRRQQAYAPGVDASMLGGQGQDSVGGSEGGSADYDDVSELEPAPEAPEGSSFVALEEAVPPTAGSASSRRTARPTGLPGLPELPPLPVLGGAPGLGTDKQAAATATEAEDGDLSAERETEAQADATPGSAGAPPPGLSPPPRMGTPPGRHTDEPAAAAAGDGHSSSSAVAAGIDTSAVDEMITVPAATRGTEPEAGSATPRDAVAPAPSLPAGPPGLRVADLPLNGCNLLWTGEQKEVPITAEHGLDRTAQSTVGEAQMFKDWVATVDRDPKLFVDDIHLQSVDMVGPRVGHVKFKTTARVVSAGRAKTVIDVPGIVFMRGGSVGVLVILECDGTEYTILTRQPRVPVGRHDFPEIPAGMLDGSGNFKGVAAEAIQRACGIVITEDELVDLTGLTYGDKFRGVVPSASGCDEYVKLYMMRRHVEEAVISDLQGRLNGISADGEPFKLQIVELKDAWQLTPDVKALSALALFKHLRDSARLPERALRGQGSNGARRVTSIDALVDAANYAEAGSLVRYGRHFSSKFEGSTELTVAEESAAVEAASTLPPGQSASVTMRSISGALAQVPITAAPGMDARVVASSPAFAEWVSEVDRDPALFVQDIHIQSVDMFGPRVGYVKFKATAKARIDDQTVIDVPGIVFMRGGSVGVLVILECDGTEYTILTRQPRVPVGRHDFPEIPAGMLDGSGNFKGVAADEIQQECGITIQETELCDLTQLAYGGQFKGVIPSAGACDEFIRLYTVARHVDREVIDKLQGQLTGMLSEGEVIKLEIIELSRLWETSPDAKALSALALRDYLKLHHRLPGSRGQKALSVGELSHDDEDGIHRGGKFQEGLPESQASPTALAKVGRLTKAWSMTSVDAEIEEQSEHPAKLPTDKHGGNGSLDAPLAEPTYVKQAKKERARRRSVSFGHENRAAMKSLAAQDDVQGERRPSVSFGQVSDSIPPPGLIATKSSAAGSKGPSPRSAMRRGSLQHTYLQQQHASTTTGSNESSSEASRPSVTIALEHPHGSAPDAHYPSINNIETSRWAPPMGTADVMPSRNSTDPSRNPFATKDFGFRDETFGVREGGNQSLASVQREYALFSSHDDVHATMSADEDEVDRLMMEDLLEATQSTLVLGSGSRRDVVVKVKVVHEPPTYLAALYAKADASNQVQSVLMVLTIVALFGDDFRVVFLPKGADPIASAITFVIFIIFSLEWMCNCLFKPAYLYSLFFWLDIMATLSLITDVSFMYEAIFGEMTAISTIETVCQPAAAHVGTTADALMAVDSTSGTGEIESTGRAARVASRTARVVRILRVLRVIRIFKLLKFLGRKSVVVEEDPKDLRNSTTKMGERLVERISHRVIMIVLVLFVGTILVLQGFEPIDYGPQTGLDWMGSMRTNSTVGGAPIISNMAANTYVASVHQIILCLKDVGEGGVLFRHMPELISTRRDIEIQVNWAADASVLSATDHRESIVSQAWTNLTTIGVLLVIMVGSNYVFSHDIEELVVRKISVIVDSVNKMAVTLKFLGGEKVEDDEEDEEEMETEMIETAMEKMSELLRIGYGHAGNTIISKNLRGTGELNAMLPGQHVTAVFGFCDIRQFNEITDVLRGQVMPFVNQIAKIVHEEVVLNDGAPNKNIGDAFLCSWKTEEFTETPRSQEGLDQHEQKKHKLRMRRLSLAKPSSKDMDALAALAENGDLEIPLEYHTKADQALKSFVDIIAKLRSRKTELILRKRHPRLYMHRPSFKVDMGFGLHHGWAIEGAIGSVHKVDVSYLSPHVNMSARLEAATKQFGVPLLLSGSFVKLLSAGVRDTCRKLDQVKVVGSTKVVELWTRDVPRIQNRAFIKAFETAVDLYLKGTWDTAMEKLYECEQHKPGDPPTLALMGTIHRMGVKDRTGASQAPSGWPGWRQLQSK